MDELLKENTSPDQGSNIEEIIDAKLAAAMEKFTEQLSKVVEPSTKENNIKEDNEDGNEEGDGAGDEEGTDEEVDS
jgi:rRNA maturation endonuclease Nob1